MSYAGYTHGSNPHPPPHLSPTVAVVVLVYIATAAATLTPPTIAGE